MEEKVYPSAKPPPPSSSPPQEPTSTPPSALAPPPSDRNIHFPPPKTRPYAAARPRYLPLRPPLPEKRRRRGCCCCLFLLSSLLLIVAVILSVVAGALFYVLYQPRRPSFSISNLAISRFNLTSPSENLDFRANFSIAIHNKNKRIEFIYDRMPVLMKYEDSGIGRGVLPPLIQPRKNTTILSTLISPSGLDTSTTDSLRSRLGRKKESVTVGVQIDTGIRVRVSGFKTKRIKIRVSCGGIRVPIDGGRAISSYSSVKCKTGVRIKIWRWTITTK